MQAKERVFALYAAGEVTEALALAERLLPLDDRDPFLWNLAAVCHRRLGHGERAASRWLEALRLKPDFVEACNNLGSLLAEEKRYAEGERFFRQALAIRPDHADAWYNLAILLTETRRHAEAEGAYLRALEREPGHMDARYNLGLLRLSQGRFAAGWPLHESRYHPDKSGRQSMPLSVSFPMWRGEELTGRRVLVIPEQGYGDQLQFCRYLALLKARGVTCLTLVCPPLLQSLFATLPGVDRVVAQTGSGVCPPHDYWTFLLSLPLHLGGVPATLPYLFPSRERVAHWNGRLFQGAGLRVGLVWKGSPTNSNDAHRSLPGLEVLAPLWSVPGVRFISLQKGNGEAQAVCPPPGQPLLNLGGGIRDFADTAAIVSLLDLVIGIDSAVVHLAGALGKPCWVMLSACGTDWRWMHDRADSPWYPGVMRLFRQDRPDDWSGVVEAVAGELRRAT
ncbi:MAG: glycosyltransferase family protein [Magnetococcales bacterium]|nr:glycosyltransferase family protein [Magnetococcales bacterium]